MAKNGTGPGTAVVDRDAELKRQIETQQKMLAAVSTSSKFISFKGGNIIIDKTVVPGAKTEVIVLAVLAERAMHEKEYDPDERQSPCCYAYARIGEDGESEEMAPHPEAAKPQNKTCKGCEWDKFRTALKGKGKRCRESLRLAILPAGKDMKKSDIWHARIPITSVSKFKEFAGIVLGSGRQLHSVVAELSVTPDPKNFFNVNWRPLRQVDQKDVVMVEAKALAAQATIDFPYPNFDEEEQQTKGQGAKPNAKLSRRGK